MELEYGCDNRDDYFLLRSGGMKHNGVFLVIFILLTCMLGKISALEVGATYSLKRDPTLSSSLGVYTAFPLGKLSIIPSLAVSGIPYVLLSSLGEITQTSTSYSIIPSAELSYHVTQWSLLSADVFTLLGSEIPISTSANTFSLFAQLGAGVNLLSCSHYNLGLRLASSIVRYIPASGLGSCFEDPNFTLFVRIGYLK